MKLSKLFGKMVEQEVDQEAMQRQYDEQVGSMWNWLRLHLDAACDVYLTQGKDDDLRLYLTGQALNDTISHLDSLRQQSVRWSFPDRRSQAQTRLRVEEVIADPDQGDSYVVSEFFRDFSRLEWYQNDQLVDMRQNSGKERGLRATIRTDNDKNYFISDVVPIEGL
jgi:hypothetical protein